MIGIGPGEPRAVFYQILYENLTDFDRNLAWGAQGHFLSNSLVKSNKFEIERNEINRFLKLVPFENKKKSLYIKKILQEKDFLKIFFNSELYLHNFDLVLEDENSKILPKHELIKTKDNQKIAIIDLSQFDLSNVDSPACNMELNTATFAGCDANKTANGKVMNIKKRTNPPYRSAG